jgi:hypothetical protein
MLYHCGLLSERPETHRTLNWIKRPHWGRMPEDVEHELSIWLAMPGFPVAFHAHTLAHGPAYIKPHMGRFEELRDEVIENWSSATPEDCQRLSRMRPGTGNIPIICQHSMLQEVKAGRRQTDIAEDYRVHEQTVHQLVRHGVRSSRGWPSWLPRL